MNELKAEREYENQEKEQKMSESERGKMEGWMPRFGRRTAGKANPDGRDNVSFSFSFFVSLSVIGCSLIHGFLFPSLSVPLFCLCLIIIIIIIRRIFQLLSASHAASVFPSLSAFGCSVLAIPTRSHGAKQTAGTEGSVCSFHFFCPCFFLPFLSFRFCYLERHCKSSAIHSHPFSSFFFPFLFFFPCSFHPYLLSSFLI